jgi:hypothetical protein
MDLSLFGTSLTAKIQASDQLYTQIQRATRPPVGRALVNMTLHLLLFGLAELELLEQSRTGHRIWFKSGSPVAVDQPG